MTQGPLPGLDQGEASSPNPFAVLEARHTVPPHYKGFPPNYCRESVAHMEKVEKQKISEFLHPKDASPWALDFPDDDTQELVVSFSLLKGGH